VTTTALRWTSHESAPQVPGQSAALQCLARELAIIARNDDAVLITGGASSDRELVAHAIHAASARRQQPLIIVNCAALSESTLHAELFGHGGTLVLDAIDELPLGAQARVLGVLQDGSVARPGCSLRVELDVRVLATSRRGLEQLVAEGRFRDALLRRIKLSHVEVPPLPEHAFEDAIRHHEVLPLTSALQEFEHDYLLQALQRSDGNRSRAASMLGISRKALWAKLRRYHAQRTPQLALVPR